MKTIGERFSPILAEIEDALWEYEAQELGPPHFTDEGFRAAIKILMCAALDRMWRVQKNENMSMGDRAKMAQRLGEELRGIIKTYTDVDTHDLYKKETA